MVFSFSRKHGEYGHFTMLNIWWKNTRKMREQIFRFDNVNLFFFSFVLFICFKSVLISQILRYDLIWVWFIFHTFSSVENKLHVKIKIKTSSVKRQENRNLFKVWLLYSLPELSCLQQETAFLISPVIFTGEMNLCPVTQEVCVLLQNAEQSASNFHRNHQDLWQWNSHPGLVTQRGCSA